nr:succinate dehydrogenase, cytochrome b556 subunit [Anaerolineae bacterium]
MEHIQKTDKDTIRPRNLLKAWFDVRKRRVGSWAFALNRLTGLGLVVYLLLHLVVLSILLQGEAGWDKFIALARHPLFLLMDVVLIFGILFHGLNGIRVALVGMGIGVRSHKALFWILMVIALAALVTSAVLIYTI